MKTLLLVVVVAACGGAKDDCERFAEKMATVGGNEHKLAADCQADPSVSKSPVVKCVLAAETQKAVHRCMREEADVDKESAAKLAEREAVARAEQAQKDAMEAMEKVTKIEADLGALSQRVDAAIQAVMAAQNDADRRAANERLLQLQREKAEMERRIHSHQHARTEAA